MLMFPVPVRGGRGDGMAATRSSNWVLVSWRGLHYELCPCVGVNWGGAVFSCD